MKLSVDWGFGTYRANQVFKTMRKTGNCVVCGESLRYFNRSKHPRFLCMKGTCLEKFNANKKEFEKQLQKIRSGSKIK